MPKVPLWLRPLVLCLSSATVISHIGQAMLSKYYDPPSVSDPMPCFVLHKDLFSVCGYVGYGQVLMMEKIKHTTLPCLCWVNGFLFCFAGKKKKKDILINRH